MTTNERIFTEKAKDYIGYVDELLDEYAELEKKWKDLIGDKKHIRNSEVHLQVPIDRLEMLELSIQQDKLSSIKASKASRIRYSLLSAMTIVSELFIGLIASNEEDQILAKRIRNRLRWIKEQIVRAERYEIDVSLLADPIMRCLVILSTTKTKCDFSREQDLLQGLVDLLER